MPPRPPSRCYQALQSPAHAPVEAVWMTDDVLGRSFRRYLDSSKAHRRTITFAPGPMYHRKRLGRRQMAELYSLQSTGALPVWALPNAPDMTEWKWQPPKQDLWSPWPATPPTPLPAPPIPALAPLPEPDSVTQPPLEPDSHEVAIFHKSKSQRSTWKRLHVRLTDIRTNCATSMPTYNDNFWAFFYHFEYALSRGRISGPAAADIYKTAARDMADVERLFSASSRTLRLSLLSHLASGVELAREAGHNLLLRPSGSYMLHIAEHEANVHSAELFTFAATNLLTRTPRRNYKIILKTLDHFFDLWRGGELHGNPENYDWPEISMASHLANIWAGRLDRSRQDVEAWLANGQVQEACRELAISKRCLARSQRFILKAVSLMSNDSIIAGKIACGLRGYQPKHYRILFIQATKHLFGPTGGSRAKYNWLQVLARLPRVHTSHFKRSLRLFPRRGHAALSYTELCNLLLLHWESKGKIKPGGQTRRVWNSLRNHNDDGKTVLAALALAVNLTTSAEKCTGIFWSFWDILRDRGRPKTFLRQLSFLSKREKLSSGFLKRLAWSSNDHRIALSLHSLALKQSDKAINRNLWWPAFWEKFAGRLKRHWKYPLVDPGSLVTKLLAPDSNTTSEPVEHPHHKDLDEIQSLDEQLASYATSTTLDQEQDEYKPIPKSHQKQVENLKFGLRLIAMAGQCTDRQALRIVTQFTAVLANKQGYLSARDLATLTTVMMRTLDKGQNGSNQRFKWYLGIIYRFLGEDACVKVGMILKRRRDANWLIWRRTLARRVESAREKRDFAREAARHQRLNSQRKSLWERFVNSARPRAQRIRKLKAPMKRLRGELRQLCRSRVGIGKAVKANATKAADTPLALPSSEGVDMALSATKDEDQDVCAVLLTQTQRETAGHGVTI